MVDGYTRLQAFVKVVLPQATTGIAATAIFCLIFAWNEYAFAVLLTSGNAQTMPPFIPFIIGEGGQDWPAVAAGTTLVPGADPVFTCCCASISCAASPSERCANERTSRRVRLPPRWLRRGPWRRRDGAHRLGVVMLMQPFSLTLYSWSFLVITLVGTVMFVDRQSFSGSKRDGQIG
jgi:hypothetical protein